MSKKSTPMVARSWLIPYEVMEQLKEYARTKDVSVNSLVVEAIKAYLEQQNRKE